MPARSKKRAKFNFNGRDFMWYVDADTWLRICSANKTYVTAFLLYHPHLDISKQWYLQVIGHEFPAVAASERPLGLVVPDEVAAEIRTSMGSLVDAILNWSFDPSPAIVYHPLNRQPMPSA